MSDSDVLSIQLWLGGGAIAFLAIAVTAAGWNHKVFIAAMFGIAALTAATSICFRSILPILPDQLGEALNGLSNNKVAWLFLSAAGMCAVLFIARLKGKGAVQIHGRVFPVNIGVYIGRIAVSPDKLDSDLFITIAIIAYNGTTKLISIGSIRGLISYNGVQLPEPTLLSDRSPLRNIAIASEFMVVIEQRIPRTVADDILRKLAEKSDRNRVIFDLSKMDILAFFPPNSQSSTRLPIWNSFTVDEEGPRVMPVASVAVGLTEPTDKYASTALEKISLFEAATIAYGRTKNRPISILVEGLTESPDGILTWYCDVLTKGYDHLSPIKLFGIRPPDPNEEEIYMPPYTNYEFVVERNTIVFQEKLGNFRFENLRVYKAETEAAIQYLSALEM